MLSRAQSEGQGENCLDIISQLKWRWGKQLGSWGAPSAELWEGRKGSQRLFPPVREWSRFRKRGCFCRKGWAAALRGGGEQRRGLLCSRWSQNRQESPDHSRPPPPRTGGPAASSLVLFFSVCMWRSALLKPPTTTFFLATDLYHPGVGSEEAGPCPKVLTVWTSDSQPFPSHGILTKC